MVGLCYLTLGYRPCGLPQSPCELAQKCSLIRGSGTSYCPFPFSIYLHSLAGF